MNDKKPGSGVPLASTPIASAAFQGELVDLVKKAKLNKLNTEQQPVRATRHGDYVAARNDSGSDLDIGNVLQIDDKDLDEIANYDLWFSGVEPDADSTEAGGRVKGFGILTQPAPDGEIENDNLQVSGVCIAKVAVSDEDHAYADVESGSHVLASAVSGPCHIIYKPSGTGTFDCVVVFGGSAASESVRLFETTEKLNLGGKCKAKQLRRIGTSKEFETFGDEFYVNDHRRDATHLYGQYIAGPGYRGVCCLPTPATITSMSILSILSLAPPFSMSASPIENEWQIVDLEYVANAIEFLLTEDMNATTGISQNATVVDYYDGKNPGTTQHIHDPRGLFKRALIGAKGWAVRIPWGDGDPAGDDWPEGRYVAVECQSKAGFIAVTLDADRDAGGAAEAINCTLAGYHGTQQDIQGPTDSTLQVWFREGWFPDAANGDRYYAAYDSEADKYWAIGTGPGTSSSNDVLVFNGTENSGDTTYGTTAKYTRVSSSVFHAGSIGATWTWNSTTKTFTCAIAGTYRVTAAVIVNGVSILNGLLVTTLGAVVYPSAQTITSTLDYVVTGMAGYHQLWSSFAHPPVAHSNGIPASGEWLGNAPVTLYARLYGVAAIGDTIQVRIVANASSSVKYCEVVRTLVEFEKIA